MSELTTVARPYAKAAFDFAVEQKAVEQWQLMLEFAAQVAVNPTVKDMLVGALASEKLADLFIQVCGEQLDQSGQNFIRVLAENERLAVLPTIVVLFKAFKAEFDKTIDVDVASATELTGEQQDKISASLEKRLARKVKLNCTVDPQLIAGVVISANDMVIDGSVRSKLNRLSDALQA